VAGRPLRPATDRRLGGPLPHQLANPPQTPPPATPLSQEAFLVHPTVNNLCGISISFEMLFPTKGQVIYVLLTRPPLSPRRRTVRLACIRHAASVCPEPGSNSPNKDSDIRHTDFQKLHWMFSQDQHPFRTPAFVHFCTCTLVRSQLCTSCSEELTVILFFVVSLTTLQLLRSCGRLGLVCCETRVSGRNLRIIPNRLSNVKAICRAFHTSLGTRSQPMGSKKPVHRHRRENSHYIP
jgi:hypothetical protein